MKETCNCAGSHIKRSKGNVSKVAVDALEVRCLSLNGFLKYDLFISTRMNCVAIGFLPHLVYSYFFERYLVSFIEIYMFRVCSKISNKTIRCESRAGDILSLIVIF